MPHANTSERTQPDTASPKASRVLDAVRDRVGSAAFDRYFAHSTRALLDDAGVSIEVPSAFHAELIARRFDAELRDAVRAAHGEHASLRLRVSEPEAPGRSAAPDRSPAHPREASAHASPARDARPDGAPDRGRAPSRTGRTHAPASRATRTLDAFVEGECNRLALAMARRVAAGDAPRSFSPLLVEGACGMGKSHLVAGIATEYAARHPGAVVKCISGEDFVSAFVGAVREHRVDAMRRGFRGLDLLCIDDVHLVAGKQRTQEELLHILNELDLRGTFLVLASDAPPASLAELSRQLASRFSCGAHARLDPPEPEHLARIARSMAAARGLMLSDDAGVALADHARPGASPREIEGLVTRVEAAVRLLPDLGASDAPITRRSVDAALGSARARRARPVRPEEIVELVCRELAVELGDVRARGRHPRVVLARAVAASLCRSHTTASFPEIAGALGRPNHSSVVTACGRLKKQIAGEADIPPVLQLDPTRLATLVERLGGLARRLGHA